MAPPRNRRPGFSRRIQFGLFIGYVVAVIGAVCALALVVINRLDPEGFSLLQTQALDLSAPVVGAGRSVIDAAQEVEDGVTAYIRAGNQNRALRVEMEQARRRLIEAQSVRRQNEVLRRTLKLLDHHSAPVVTARIIGSSLGSARRYATLAAGASNGVRPGQPVIAADGLIGRVLDTGGSAARVLLLTDGESAVPVRITRSSVPALARGRGDGTLLISALLPGARPFASGDVVATSGTGGIYPPDVPVATITRVDGDSAIAWPLANPDSADFVIVRQPYQPALPPARAVQPGG